MKKWATAAAAVAVAASLVLTATPASASVSAPSETAAVQQRIDRVLVGVNEASKTFDGAVSTAAGATPEDTKEFATGWVAAGGSAMNVAVSQRDVDELRATATEIQACSGRNSADVTGLQANLYLSSCNANKIIAALAGGAGVAALVGIITAATGIGGAAGGIAAALLTIGSAAVAYCAANGRGIGFHVAVVGPPWCKSQ